MTKWIDVRDGEGVIVAKATATLFGIIAAHTMLETARDALFLQSMAPSALTYVYGMLAGLAIGASRLNSVFVRRFGRRNALIFTLGAAAYGTIVFYLLPASSQLYFAFYLWSGLLGTVMAVQFWMFAGRRFTVAQGKRLFGPLASGGVLGAVFGASASLLILRITEVDSLLLSASGLFIATSMLLTSVSSDDISLGQRSKEKLLAGLDSFRKEPYLRRLSFLIGISTITVLCGDYMFKAAAAKMVEPAKLGDFFATYYAVLNGIALFVQLGLSAALVRRLGIVTAAAILPILLLAGGMGVVIAGGAFVAIMLTKGADGTLRHSLHRISLELLWMPLSEETRTGSKVFVDTVVTRGSQALAAGGLFALARFGQDTPTVLGGVVATLALVWLGFALGLRKLYLELFRKALGGQRREDNLRLDLRSIEVVTEALSNRDPIKSIAAMDLLASNGRSRLIPALILYHENIEVLRHALQVVATPDRTDWVPLAERLLEHDDEEVRVEALRPLAQSGAMDAVQGRLLDISPYVRAHAAFWLAEASNDAPSDRPGVKQIIAMEGSAGQRARIGLLNAVATAGNPRWATVVITLSTSSETRVVKAAARAMSRLHDERFVPLLADRLRYRDGRSEVREALVSIGQPALDFLSKVLRDADGDSHLRHHVPRTISRFGTQEAADVLVKQMAVEDSGRVRYKILRGLGRMVADFGVRIDHAAIEEQTKRNLTEFFDVMGQRTTIQSGREKDEAERAQQAGDLLLGLLADKQAQALDRAFRLLHIRHPRENLRGVAKAAQAQDSRVRAQALEFLDALTLDAKDPEIRTMFRLAVDDLNDEQRVGRAVGMTADLPEGREQSLVRLIEGRDESLAAVASFYALHLGMPNAHVAVKRAAEKRAGSVLDSLVDAIAPGGLPSAT